MNSVIPEKLKELLDDVKSVYESKGMIVYPNSFSKLETEIVKVCNENKNIKDKFTKAKNIINGLVDDYISIGFAAVDTELIDEATEFLEEIK